MVKCDRYAADSGGWHHPKLRSAYLGFSEVPPLRGFYCGYAAGYRLKVIGYGLILVVFLCSPPVLQPPGIYRRQMLVTPQKGRQTSLRMIMSTLQVYGWLAAERRYFREPTVSGAQP